MTLQILYLTILVIVGFGTVHLRLSTLERRLRGEFSKVGVE